MIDKEKHTKDKGDSRIIDKEKHTEVKYIEIKKGISESVKAAMKLKNISSSELANSVGVSLDTIRRLENGESTVITNAVTILLIAETLNIPVELLMNRPNICTYREMLYRTKSKEIDKEAIYYVISYIPECELMLFMQNQDTEDKAMINERYNGNLKDWCIRHFYNTPIIIDTEFEVEMFKQAGGVAIVLKEIADTYMSDLFPR